MSHSASRKCESRVIAIQTGAVGAERGLIDLPKRELLLGMALTGAVATLLLVFGPAPGDAPAHLYRTLLVRQGALFWDNLWFAGNYPFASYSLLYYPPAALVGNLPLVFAAAIASTALFCSIAYREWGDAALWPCRVFGVLAAAPIFTGLYSYSLGFTAMLAALRLFQGRRIWLGAALAAVTLGFSPLAFLFLCLILLAVLVSHRRLSSRALLTAGLLLAIASIEVVVMVLFPGNGVYPFNVIDLFCVVTLCCVGALLAQHARNGRAIAAFFVLWALASIACYLVPTPVGDNVTRLRAFVLPLMLLTAILARFRPRPLVVLALVGALGYNLVPYLMLVPYRLDSRPASVSFWQPALTYLHRHSGTNFRVEVVPTAAHWEAYWIPRSGLPLARGWYRQLEIADYPTLFRGRLTAAVYLAWLNEVGVKYVLLPATKLDPVDSSAEVRVLRAGTSGLEPVFTSTTGTIYAVPHPSSLLTGPGSPRITALGHQNVSGWVGRAGSYTLRIRYSRYWQVRPASACIRPARAGMITLEIREPGAFALQFPDDPGAVLDSLEKPTPDCS
jgi:hypothetical protein